MLLLTSSTPPKVRLAFYFISTIAELATAIYQAPGARHSYGRLLNLPRFGVITPKAIFRSGEPRRGAHFRHLEQLRIRTILCVKRTPIGPKLRDYATQHAIPLHHIDLGQHHIQPDAVAEALAILDDPANHPILLHCDGGRHRAGVVAAALRTHQGWSIDAIVAEYLSFARPSPFWDHLDFIATYAARHRRRAEAHTDGLRVTVLT